jgi:transposase InsO family protein
VDYVRHWKARTEIPAKRIVRWIGVAEGKFYDWKQRYGRVNEHNGWIPRDHWLTVEERQAILEFHDKYPLEGYRRLTYMMLDANLVAASPSSVYRALKDAGVIGRRATKRSSKGTGFKQPSGPHRHWHVDISFLNIAGTFYPLCSVLDGYSRYLVHWEIRQTMTESEIEIILQRAREKWPGETPRVITDNGPQFIAKDFKEFIRISGMTHVKTSPYYPQSNGKLERYHRTIKADCIRPGTPLSPEDANRLIEKFVRHYNQVRLHSAIGYITPQDKLLGREQEIFDERDRKLEAARQHRAQRRQAWRESLQEVRSQALCYNKDAWAEDRALLGSNPSADSGPEAKHEVASPPPHFLPNDSLLARSDKSQGVWGRIPQGTQNQRCLPFDTTPPAALDSRIENSGSR